MSLENLLASPLITVLRHDRRAQFSAGLCIGLIAIQQIGYSKRRSPVRGLVHFWVVDVPRAVVAAFARPASQFGLVRIARTFYIRWLFGGKTEDVRAMLNTANEKELETQTKKGLKVVEVCEDFEGGTVKGRWFIHDEIMRENTICLLWFHGGGYVFQNAANGAAHHYELLKEFNNSPLAFDEADPAKKSRRLDKFPTQLLEAVAAYQWLVSVKSVKKLVVGGDSAGAHLAIALMNAITTRLQHVPVKPIASVLMAPWVNPFLKENAKIFSDASFRAPFDYCDFTNNKTAIHTAEKGTLVIYGSIEIIVDSIRSFVARLRNQNTVGLEVYEYPNEMHCFNKHNPISGNGRDALVKTAAFLHKLF
ncbi:alpha/beta-hydrolase [Rhizoclosmatium globosum]|uniref:Alpha/beta-hydrolase n=1 Tax=Rhizoclosmatium globosum TaxID=329046 RepID=A0A1Y2CTM6_9FUNG|nr:alpha/beta-hydrolase [Rhizoclosmatium globosum]|eukprot:ORY50410.1 alpha/beta-hydrolase [Rhizoclosmatium globosum]